MIYILSKENLELAKEEVCVLAQTNKSVLYKNVLLCPEKVPYERLAYTVMVLEEVFVSNKIEEDIDWGQYYHDNFCVRCSDQHHAKELAGMIWRRVKSPRVKLQNSSTEIWLFLIDGMFICGKKVYVRNEQFSPRRPDLRPGFFPVSLKPKLARGLVNLSGVIHGTVWDPFCGTGGIILEAALMRLKVIGTDIDYKMIEAAQKNFLQYNLNGDFKRDDARYAVKNCDAIVTDPPYGRRASLKKVEIETLYREFLDHVYSFVSKVIIMAPEGIELKTKYSCVFETKEYVHRSLTRRILILKK